MFIRTPEDSWGRMERHYFLSRMWTKQGLRRYLPHSFPYNIQYLGFENTEIDFPPIILHILLIFNQYLQYCPGNFHKNSF